MIYGIGTDLCEVSRIEKSIARPAFLQRVYAPAELEQRTRVNDRPRPLPPILPQKKLF